MRGVFAGVPTTGQPDAPPSHSHIGEALRVRHLQEGVQPRVEPAHAHAHAHQPPPLRLHVLRKNFPPKDGPQDPHVHAHRRRVRGGLQSVALISTVHYGFSFISFILRACCSCKTDLKV